MIQTRERLKDESFGSLTLWSPSSYTKFRRGRWAQAHGVSEKNVGMEEGGFVEFGTWDQQNMLMLSCTHS